MNKKVIKKPKKRMCSVANLLCGAHFSFKKNGKIFVAGDRFIIPGKRDYRLSLHYFGVVSGRSFHGHIKYSLDRAQSRMVYLKDLENRASRVIPENKVFYK